MEIENASVMKKAIGRIEIKNFEPIKTLKIETKSDILTNMTKNSYKCLPTGAFKLIILYINKILRIVLCY